MKNVLWDVLNKVQKGEMEAGQADSVASTAREIIRTTSLQLKIASQSNRAIPADVFTFFRKVINRPSNRLRFIGRA